MWVYFSLYSLLAILGLLVTRPSAARAVLWFLSCALIVFMGWRYETGCDYASYQLRYEYFESYHSWWSYVTETEPAFALLNYALHVNNADYVWLNVIASVLIVLGLDRFSRLSHAPILLTALFFPILIVQLGMSGLRQALALSFLLLGLVAFVHKRKLLTACLILVGAQFHESCYIFLPLSWLAGRTFSVAKGIAALVVLGPVAIYLLGDRFDVYTDRYIEQIYGENSSAGAVYRFALALLPMLLFEMHRARVQAAFAQTYDLMRIFSLITIAMIPVGLVSTVALHRLTFYVLPVSLFTLVCVLSVLPNKTRISRDWLIVGVLIFGAYTFVWFSYSQHARACYVPYKSHLLLD
jgi:hypothetical protein